MFYCFNENFIELGCMLTFQSAVTAAGKERSFVTRLPWKQTRIGMCLSR